MIYKGMVCEWCGATFTAKKSNTKYCSHRCANLAHKQRMRVMAQSIVERHQANESLVSDARCEILSPKLLAKYLGVCKSTVYNYLQRGLVPAIQTKGKTLIRRSDIDKLFDNAPPYSKRQRKNGSEGKEEEEKLADVPACGSPYITIKEVAEKYGLSFSGADKILRESGLTIIIHKNKHFYYLNDVESLFRRRESQSHPEIKEWYTVVEIQEKYGLKPTSVYDLASTCQIPTRKVHNVTYYSKIHVDLARGIKHEGSELWYTVQEAMARYSQSRDEVYSVLRYNNIERVKQGKFVKFRRSDYDNVMKYIIK